MTQETPQLATEADVADFVRGLTVLGTGGGGRPEAGLDALEPLVRTGRRLGWVELASLPDGGTYCALSGLGSIAPTQPWTAQERLDRGYPAEPITEQPMVRALRALEAQVGKRIDGIYPIELGAGNTTTPLAAAVALGLPMVDCDCAGRAIPEMSQSSVARAGIPFAPAAFADHWGTVLTVTQCHGTLLGERLGKAISTVTKAADMQFVRNLACEFGARGITANCIAPGTFTTEMARSQWDDPAAAQPYLDRNPSRRFGDPSEVAGLAVMLASPSGGYINGQTIAVDGGHTITFA